MRSAAIAAILICRLVLVPACAAPALAAESGQLWSYGDSKFTVEIDPDGQVRVFFYQPRSGLVEEGVVKGTLLFDGKTDGGKISGQSRLFRKDCGMIAFRVSGTYNSEKGKISLTGRMPRRDDQCAVESRIEAELVLVRTRARAPVAPSNVATAAVESCPVCRSSLKACLNKIGQDDAADSSETASETASAGGDPVMGCYRGEETYWSRTFLKKIGESGIGETAAARQLSYIGGVCAEGNGPGRPTPISTILCRIDAMARTVDGLQSEAR
ncbi:exported hypothetical protein [uncultured Gammaproteobacteria bacterium]